MEESTLAHLTPQELLPDVFAWYSLIGTAGTALGMLVNGWIIHLLKSNYGWKDIPSYRVIFFVYAAIGIIKLLLALGLSRKVEAEKKKDAQEQPNSETQPLLGEQNSAEQEEEEQPPTYKSLFPSKKSLFSTLKKKSPFASIDKELWSLVVVLFILFGLDSFASGLAPL